MKTKHENLQSVLRFEVPEKVPFIIWNTAPFCCSLAGVKQEDYYFDARIKLNVHLKLHNTFHESILFPGPWPDFGASLEPSMFGSEPIWYENQPPGNKHVINEYKDILNIKFTPQKSLLPIMLQQYRYMWKRMDSNYIYEEGFLDGLGYLLGPLETAATLMNYTDFLVGIYDSPELLHKLLDIITDGLIHSLLEQQKINGKLKRVFMCDHMSHQVSREVFDEFCFPYYKRIFDEFPNAVKMYHNEGNLLHIANEVPDFGANIIHYGTSTIKLKNILKNKVVLMGNLDPIEIMLKGDEETVYEKALECLRDGAQGGGLLLSTAGGMAPNTPKENVYAAIRATQDYEN